jgi:hypothetical protein
MSAVSLYKSGSGDVVPRTAAFDLWSWVSGEARDCRAKALRAPIFSPPASRVLIRMRGAVQGARWLRFEAGETEATVCAAFVASPHRFVCCPPRAGPVPRNGAHHALPVTAYARYVACLRLRFVWSWVDSGARGDCNATCIIPYAHSTPELVFVSISHRRLNPVDSGAGAVGHEGACCVALASC